MRAAKPDELREHALPILTATVSESELHRWFPFTFEEISDPWAAPEPSKGALLQLASGDYFVIYWGKDSGQMTVRLAPSADASAFLKALFREVPLRRSRVTWLRDDVELPTVFRVLDNPEPSPPVKQKPVATRGRVLIAEGDDATAHRLAELMNEEGLLVHRVSDGEEAVRRLAMMSYHIILLDLILPRVSGTDVLEHLVITRPELLSHVIVVTGLDVDEVRKLFPDIRAALSKPIVPARVIAAVRQIVGDDSQSQVS